MMKKLGPGILITAAFIGPGTVTTCILAGVHTGFSLLWALLLSVLATILLQEMAARLGLITQNGLVAALDKIITNQKLKNLVLGLVLLAIVLGNIAYEGGNIGGAVLGLQGILSINVQQLLAFGVGGVVFLLLWFGTNELLKKVFFVLVALMSISFLATAMLTKPDLGKLITGLLIPTIQKDSVWLVIALVGTTIVPYNLFLHAALVSKHWKEKSKLSKLRLDTILSIGFGGLVSMAIIVTAAAMKAGAVTSFNDLAEALAPLYGNLCKDFFRNRIICCRNYVINNGTFGSSLCCFCMFWLAGNFKRLAFSYGLVYGITMRSTVIKLWF